MTNFSVFMILQDIAPDTNWLESVSLKDYKRIIWRINEGNENKIILGDFNSVVDKIDRNGGNKTHRLYRCHSDYAMSKLVVDNGIEDLLIKENPNPHPLRDILWYKVWDRQGLY